MTYEGFNPAITTDVAFDPPRCWGSTGLASAGTWVYRKGDTAEAEPAVPGWRMSVDELFE